MQSRTQNTEALPTLSTPFFQVVILCVYVWETAEWINNRFQLVDSYSWDDPLDDVYAGVFGIAWGQAFASAWKAPTVVPAATRLLNTKYTAMAVVYGTGASITMAMAWHTNTGHGSKVAMVGLLRYAAFTSALSFLFAWMNTRSAGDLQRWPSPLWAKAFWYSTAVTNTVRCLHCALIFLPDACAVVHICCLWPPSNVLCMWFLMMHRSTV